MSDNYIYECERQEARDAAIHASPFTPCYQHRYAADGRGGGVCECGETLDRDEL